MGNMGAMAAWLGLSRRANEYVGVFAIYFQVSKHTSTRVGLEFTYIGCYSDMIPSRVSRLEDELSSCLWTLVGSKRELLRNRVVTGRGQPRISACSESGKD